jgi:hypothetical protein
VSSSECRIYEKKIIFNKMNDEEKPTATERAQFKRAATLGHWLCKDIGVRNRILNLWDVTRPLLRMWEQYDAIYDHLRTVFGDKWDNNGVHDDSVTPQAYLTILQRDGVPLHRSNSPS